MIRVIAKVFILLCLCSLAFSGGNTRPRFKLGEAYDDENSGKDSLLLPECPACVLKLLNVCALCKPRRGDKKYRILTITDSIAGCCSSNKIVSFHFNSPLSL